MLPSNAQRSHVQQGGSQAHAAAASSQQARVMASSRVARQGNSQARIVWTAGATVYTIQTWLPGSPNHFYRRIKLV